MLPANFRDTTLAIRHARRERGAVHPQRDLQGPTGCGRNRSWSHAGIDRVQRERGGHRRFPSGRLAARQQSGTGGGHDATTDEMVVDELVAANRIISYRQLKIYRRTMRSSRGAFYRTGPC